jgi:Putative peptidase (DUF1758)
MSAKLEFLILPRIADDLPTNSIDMRTLLIPSNVTIVDPQLHNSGQIDMLLGAEVFHQVLTNRSLTIGQELPTLFETKFRWIIDGLFQHQKREPTIFCGLATVSIDN